MSGPILAVAQAPSLPGRILENVEQAIALIRNAADEGAGYVVLPELFLSGYDVQGIIDRPDLHVLALDEVPCRRLQEACANKRIVAVIGGAFALEDGVANGALVIARDGWAAHVYRKVHLWGNENEAFVAGRRPTLLSFSDLRIGMAICFDAGFPEHMRALALAGADVIVCPSAFADNDERRRYELYKDDIARAIVFGVPDQRDRLLDILQNLPRQARRLRHRQDRAAHGAAPASQRRAIAQ